MEEEGKTPMDMENPPSSGNNNNNVVTSPAPLSPLSDKPLGGWRAIKYILANETFEKLASMSLIANITVYLKTKYNMDGILLVNVVSIWSGSSNITAILGALLADCYIGRYRTLLFGSITSLVGMLFMTLSAGIPQLRPPTCTDPPHCTQPHPWQLNFLLVGLALLAIGAGGIRPCNIAFGADQFDPKTPKGRADLESFFNWWYFSFTMALVIALTGVVYVQTRISWTTGFAIPTVGLFLSILIFMIGYRTYIIVKPKGSVFVDMAKVLVAACKKRNIRIVSGYQMYNPPADENSHEVKIKLSHTDRFPGLHKASIITDADEIDQHGVAKNNWTLCSTQQVEEMKMLLAMFPVWVSGIVFLMAMDQQNTIGMLQAIQTNKAIGSFEIPPGWMGLSSMIALSSWIFLYECVWVKMKGKDKRMSMTRRINIGICLSIVCPLVAASIEIKRRQLAINKDTFESPMSILMLLPQFVLSGLVEAFGAVALMEYLSTQLPQSMRTVSGAVFFLSLSLASYLNSILVNILHKTTSNKGEYMWFGGSDLNMNSVEYVYCLSAGLAIVNLLYFNYYARWFVWELEFDSNLDE